jgi:hypothetical protein
MRGVAKQRKGSAAQSPGRASQAPAVTPESSESGEQALTSLVGTEARSSRGAVLEQHFAPLASQEMQTGVRTQMGRLSGEW